jgi:hypothetical protein
MEGMEGEGKGDIPIKFMFGSKEGMRGNYVRFTMGGEGF